MAKAARASKARKPLAPAAVPPPDPAALRVLYDMASEEVLRLHREAPKSNAWSDACDAADRAWKAWRRAMEEARKH